METFKVEICGLHIDVFQHVNNCRFFEFMEAARWDFIKKKNPNLLTTCQKLGIIVPVININIDFKREAKFGDTLIVQSKIENIYDTTFTQKQVIINQKTQKEITNATVTSCLVDFNLKRKIDIKGKYFDLIASMQV